MKKIIPILLCLALCLSLCACENKAVTAVEEAITAIGQVTLESGDAIAAAQAAYDALPEEDRAEVENYALLTEAQAEYSRLLDQEAVGQVEAAIDAIGEVTLESSNAIAAARAAYDGLEARLQGQVGNYGALTAAEEALAHCITVAENTITEFTSVSAYRFNMFEQTLDEWYTNMAGRAVMGLMTYLELTDGYLESDPFGLSRVFVAVNWEEGFVDAVFPYDTVSEEDTVYALRYWPDRREAVYGGIGLDMPLEDWLALMAEAGVYDEYEFVPVADMYQVLVWINEG